MCIIIDANAAHDLSLRTEDGKPVLKWLLTGGGAIIIGGDLTRELFSTGIREILVNLQRAGKLHKLDDNQVRETTDKIKRSGHCRSNDPHVIAVVLISNCRLILTKDKALQKDSKSPKIINPTISIYSSKKHRHLLKKCECF